MPFLSILLSSCRAEKLEALLEHLESTASDPASFEVLVNIDEGDAACEQVLRRLQPRMRFALSWRATPKNGGYYTLHRAYGALLADASPDSYFRWLINDELRIGLHGWDAVLKTYMNLYPDHLFRLALSRNRLRAHRRLRECLAHPEHYAVFTRAWLEAAGGFGDAWGPDSWHQGIAFFLGYCNNPVLPTKGIFRTVPVDIGLSGEEVGQGITSAQSRERKRRIKSLYRYLSTLPAQQEFYRRAQTLNAQLATHYLRQQYPTRHFTVRDMPQQRQLQLCASDLPQPLHRFSYDPCRLWLREMLRMWRYRMHPLACAINMLYMLRLTFVSGIHLISRRIKPD